MKRILIVAAAAVVLGVAVFVLALYAGITRAPDVDPPRVVRIDVPAGQAFSVLVDRLGVGEMFGSCVCLDLAEYSVTAQCAEDSDLLRIDASVLKRLMDQDLRMGYALQTRISKIYFGRYVDAMRKLQAIVMNLPLETR